MNDKDLKFTEEEAVNAYKEWFSKELKSYHSSIDEAPLWSKIESKLDVPAKQSDYLERFFESLSMLFRAPALAAACVLVLTIIVTKNRPLETVNPGAVSTESVSVVAEKVDSSQFVAQDFQVAALDKSAVLQEERKFEQLVTPVGNSLSGNVLAKRKTFSAEVSQFTQVEPKQSAVRSALTTTGSSIDWIESDMDVKVLEIAESDVMPVIWIVNR